MQIDINQVIAAYQQEIANLTHRAVLAETSLAVAQQRINKLETAATTPDTEG